MTQIKKQTLALQSVRYLNKIQKLIWFEMELQISGIDVSLKYCNNKSLKLTWHNIGDSKFFVLLCTGHALEQYFLKDIFKVKLLDQKINKLSYSQILFFIFAYFTNCNVEIVYFFYFLHGS